ncbi:hypothetical protein PFY10_17615 [Chryseobacterium daecheongense]|nr:hypothetical protein PFY10_17615 [Chryseobacterium daecheongense]
MKKIISLKTFPLIIAMAVCMTLGACRQDDENDFQMAKNNATGLKIASDKQSKTVEGKLIAKTDPPVKNGTHWKTQP